MILRLISILTCLYLQW